MTVRFRAIAVLCAVLLVSFVSLSLFNFDTARRSVREQITSSSLPLLQENIYTEIRQDLALATTISSVMANDAFLVDWALGGEEDVSAVTEYLARIQAAYGYIAAFFVSSRTSTYYHFDGVLKEISESNPLDAWYYRFVASGKAYELDVDTNEADDHRLTIFVNTRVEDLDGNLIGVAGVGIEMAGFSECLRRKQDEYERRIYLVDRSGLIQAHSDLTLVQAQSLYDRDGIRAVADQLLQPAAIPVTAEYEGREILVSSRLIPDIGWYVVVEQDVAQSLEPARRNLIRTLIIGLVASSLIVALAAYTMDRFGRRIEDLATKDSLTGAANRRELDRHLSRLLYRNKRHGNPVSIVVFDIDHFKEINDTLGHQTGDKMLCAMADVARSTIRPEDLLVRWGGDEFIVLIEGEAADAHALAERLQQACRDSHVMRQVAPMFRTTVSVGIAEYDPGESDDSFLQRADRALYRAKHTGRNRIVAAIG